MPAVPFNIEHSGFTVGIEGYSFGLIAIVVVKHPLDLAPKQNHVFAEPRASLGLMPTLKMAAEAPFKDNFE